MTADRGIAALIDELRTGYDGRVIVGICGAPGAGKSTFAELLVDELGALAIVVPMDGFHLASAVIAGTPLAERRGALDTFDAHGFVALVRRLRDEQAETVFAPRYDRSIEDPIAGAISIAPDIQIVVVEGNYLLDVSPPWVELRDLVDTTWYIEQSDDGRRVQRLVARHVEFGKTPEDAQRWVSGSDQRNAELVAAARSRADRIVCEQDDGQFSVSRP